MEKRKIFIVEDDEKIVQLLTQALENWNFSVQSVNDFYRVAEEILAENPDLILMDVNLPFFNGFHWTQEVRKRLTTPILFLSSQEDKMSKVMAMNLGADDFIEKPFDFEILLAKIQAILRRTYTFSKSQEGLQFKEYELDLEAGEVRLHEQSVPLSKNELRILRLLFEHQHRLVRRETVIEKLWEQEDFVDSNTLSVNMNRLRKKLFEIDLARYLITVKGRGFLLGENHESDS